MENLYIVTFWDGQKRYHVEVEASDEAAAIAKTKKEVGFGENWDAGVVAVEGTPVNDWLSPNLRIEPRGGGIGYADKPYVVPQHMALHGSDFPEETIINGIIAYNAVLGRNRGNMRAPLRIIDPQGRVWNARHYGTLFYARYDSNRNTVEEVYPLAIGWQSCLRWNATHEDIQRIFAWNPHFDPVDDADIFDMRMSNCPSN